MTCRKGIHKANLTWVQHAFSVRQGQAAGRFKGYMTAPFVIVADYGRALTRFPITWYHQIQTWLNSLGKEVIEKQQRNARRMEIQLHQERPDSKSAPTLKRSAPQETQPVV